MDSIKQPAVYTLCMPPACAIRRVACKHKWQLSWLPCSSDSRFGLAQCSQHAADLLKSDTTLLAMAQADSYWHSYQHTYWCTYWHT